MAPSNRVHTFGYSVAQRLPKIKKYLFLDTMAESDNSQSKDSGINIP